MKVLVTGGAGFIATNFMYYMVNKYPEYDFVNLDALTYAGNYNNIKDLEGKPNYKFVKGDITDREFIDKLFEEEKFDWVVNFAAESHVDNSIKNPGIFLTTNIEYSYLSSTTVKEIAAFGGDITQFVPEVVKDELERKMKAKRRV